MVDRLKSGVLAEPVLVGRERELEELQHYFKSAIEGRGTAVFVSGKSRSKKDKISERFLELCETKSRCHNIVRVVFK
jgi:predicted ATPase